MLLSIYHVFIGYLFDRVSEEHHNLVSSNFMSFCLSVYLSIYQSINQSINSVVQSHY